MKYLIIPILILLIVDSFFAQNCLTPAYFDPIVTPVAPDVAISTKGWTKENSLSIEFNYNYLENGWYLYDSSYGHSNANNAFSNANDFWDLSGGTLTLKFDDEPNGGYNFTAAILCHDNIDLHYGYYEIKVKLPTDEGLCTSFWGVDGWNTTYREIDVFEYFGTTLLSNEYHDIDHDGGRMTINSDIIEDSNTWYVFGYEWLPNKYSLYINNHYIGSFNPATDCVLEDMQYIRKWRLWITNWVHNSDPTGTFPKTLTTDYIRFYSLDIDNINNDFYDNWSNYDYGVWKTVHLGDTYSSDATFNDNGRHAIRSTDGFTLGAGFEVSAGTEFETIIYKP
ncbi:MAG: glycoside hydrolase family 16 protein [Bacteroidales bacterium]|nr:glycoside hydrolase family 16 protein [Bacteroidales bacterium]